MKDAITIRSNCQSVRSTITPTYHLVLTYSKSCKGKYKRIIKRRIHKQTDFLLTAVLEIAE